MEPCDRVTTIDPLPESVLERIYAQSDGPENITPEQLFAFQSQGEPQ